MFQEFATTGLMKGKQNLLKMATNLPIPRNAIIVPIPMPTIPPAKKSPNTIESSTLQPSKMFFTRPVSLPERSEMA